MPRQASSISRSSNTELREQGQLGNPSRLRPLRAEPSMVWHEAPARGSSPARAFALRPPDALPLGRRLQTDVWRENAHLSSVTPPRPAGDSTRLDKAVGRLTSWEYAQHLRDHQELYRPLAQAFLSQAAERARQEARLADPRMTVTLQAASHPAHGQPRWHFVPPKVPVAPPVAAAKPTWLWLTCSLAEAHLAVGLELPEVRPALGESLNPCAAVRLPLCLTPAQRQALWPPAPAAGPTPGPPTEACVQLTAAQVAEACQYLLAEQQQILLRLRNQSTEAHLATLFAGLPGGNAGRT